MVLHCDDKRRDVHCNLLLFRNDTHGRKIDIKDKFQVKVKVDRVIFKKNEKKIETIQNYTKRKNENDFMPFRLPG